MNLQSQINATRARMKQIRESDLFSTKEKTKLLNTLRDELLGAQFLLKAQRIQQAEFKNANKQTKNQPYQFSNPATN